MKLRFLTWNISFAYGPGSDGIQKPNRPAYRHLPLSHFQSGLASICQVIKDQQIDVAFLQEVDFDSDRSHHQNQLDILSRTSGLNYRLPIVSWDLPYVPYPGLNPQHHFGKTVSGGGVISRFPMRSIQNQLLPKPRENSFAYNLFYLSRYLQIFKLILPEQEHNCINFHLEAFSQDNRELHSIRLQDRLLDYGVAIAGGDLNGSLALKPEREKDWTLKMTPEVSFPETKERLDGWILHQHRVQVLSMSTLDTGTVSDHLPVLMEVEIKT
jgi:endonuclease/exonuclease/phosphatase family metal-dependent hydrolase